MRPLVGFYVHHHGLGHLTRTGAVLAHLGSRATVLTSADASSTDLHGAEVLRLPLDTDHDEATAASLPPLRGLHYAPVGCAGMRERTALIAAWAAEHRPAALVVDVSAEVSVLGRLLALPVLTVRQHGLRTDPAHLMAYGVSYRLLAPFPETLEEPHAPLWVRERTFYSGGFSKSDCRIEPAPGASNGSRAGRTRRKVTVLVGAGGSALDHRTLAGAAAACPGWDWAVLGRLPGKEQRTANLRCLRWVDDVFAHLLASDVVVTSGSHNSVMEVAAARRPLVCIPQERPFGEQRSKAESLGRIGAAVVEESWPRPSEWSGVLDRALQRGPGNLSRLVDGEGAARTAVFIDGIARRFAGVCS